MPPLEYNHDCPTCVIGEHSHSWKQIDKYHWRQEAVPTQITCPYCPEGRWVYNDHALKQHINQFHSDRTGPGGRHDRTSAIDFERNGLYTGRDSQGRSYFYDSITGRYYSQPRIITVGTNGRPGRWVDPNGYVVDLDRLRFSPHSQEDQPK